MTEAEKREYEARRREAAITNMYYNRYLLVRYVTALFLFIYLYWFIMLYTEAAPLYLMVLPLALLCGAGWTMWEMALMNTREQKPAKVAPMFYKVIIAVNLVLILISLLGQYPALFPLLTFSSASLLAIVIMQLSGILLSLGILSRLRRIEHKADKQYQRIQSVLASIS